ncbi:uncharacterized protein LOC107048115 [Diachasma alloeum]|uniref:uncharacterized protein LOC107048115 n=1 Tax=Diachasma alloeum TaxID=454923 RepID=UPI0007384BC6|nr:uncharacterized protein LOC107048115 [Diachasma alloeum]
MMNTQIQGAKLKEISLESSNKGLVNIVPSISTISEESERVIYNNINGRPRAVLRSNNIKWPKVPSTFLKPPTIQKHNIYSCHKKIMDEKLMKNRLVTDATPQSWSSKKEKYRASMNFYIRDHAPTQQSESSEEQKKDEKLEETQHSDEIERINFHIHGHEGPETYVFGYDTGNGNNRQFRYEERHDNGTVTGYYGYYDARGKLRKVYYTSHPSIGYESFPFENKLKTNNR